MSLYLTKEQRSFLVKQWWASGKRFRAVDGAFRNEFPDKKMPTRQAIYELVKKFDDKQEIHESEFTFCLDKLSFLYHAFFYSYFVKK